VKGTSRSLRGDHYFWNATNVRRFLGSVNCPELVQRAAEISGELGGKPRCRQQSS
jgi:hypothetical protein